MEKYKDIKDVNGGEIPPVDIICGGSPCQNLSIAGNRQGLNGSESGLFEEMIRVIKEMRNKYGTSPRYALWENVKGAYSSNKGRDFQSVLHRFIGVVEERYPDVPIPKEGWHSCGAIMGDRWSIAWRTHDAQYWGVPQRRIRISLVADFGGRTAPEILFDLKSVRGDVQKNESGENRFKDTGYAFAAVENQQTDKRLKITGDVVYGIKARCGTGGNNVPLVVCLGGTQTNSFCSYDKSATLLTHHDIQIIGDLNKETIRRLTPIECERLQGYPDNWTKMPIGGDSKRYKAIGNSIALPFWEWLAKRFVSIGNVKSVGSLFDGIGGFPLVFKRAGANTLWKCEIDDFCNLVVDSAIERGDL